MLQCPSQTRRCNPTILEDEPGKIYDKVGAIPDLCAKPLFDAVDTWVCEMGTPPVVAGTASNCIHTMYMH